MRELPKVARERLAAGPSPAPHLDSNLVAAFAEHALLPGERQRVIAHMAVCEQCRAEVQLVIGATRPEGRDGEAVRVLTTESASRKRGFYGQRLLRWQPMTAAAGVLAISLAFWVATRQASLHSARLTAKLPAPAPATTANNLAPPSPPASASSPAAAAKSPAARNAAKELEPDLRSLEKLRANAARANPLPQLDAGALNRTAGRLVSGKDVTPSVVQAESKRPAEFTVAAPPPPSPAPASAMASPAAGAPLRQSTFAAGQPLPQASSSMVNVEAAPAAGVKKAPEVMSLQRNLLAKAATSPRGVAARTIELAATWAASADASSGGAHPGAVVRSFDGGRTWQLVPVAPGVTFRVVFAEGHDVWAGGLQGAFYHSSDGGQHWSSVVLAATATAVGTPVGDIVSIQFADAAHGVVSTSTGVTWTTSDGGQTWQQSPQN